MDDPPGGGAPEFGGPRFDTVIGKERRRRVGEFARRAAGLAPAQMRSFTDDIVEPYLYALAESGQYTVAADAVGVTIQTAWVWRKKHDANGVLNEDKCRAAMQVFRDSLEREAWRRAVEGYDEPVIGGKDHDEVVAVKRKFSDQLLVMLLRRHVDEYRDIGVASTNISISQTLVTNKIDLSTLDDEKRAAVRLLCGLDDEPPNILDVENPG